MKEKKDSPTHGCCTLTRAHGASTPTDAPREDAEETDGGHGRGAPEARAACRVGSGGERESEVMGWNGGGRAAPASGGSSPTHGCRRPRAGVRAPHMGVSRSTNLGLDKRRDRCVST